MLSGEMRITTLEQQHLWELKSWEPCLQDLHLPKRPFPPFWPEERAGLQQMLLPALWRLTGAFLLCLPDVGVPPEAAASCSDSWQ